MNKRLARLFREETGEDNFTVNDLPGTASNRRYYRIIGERTSAVGAYNSDRRENEAFLYISKHLAEHNINVPEIYNADLENSIYLMEDLGDTTLFSELTKNRAVKDVPGRIIEYYKTAVEILPEIQVDSGKDLDYSKCYPRSAFDRQSVMWDLNYFKYYFLKPAGIKFDEQYLEEDFQKFTDFLLTADTCHFMYRDFQSRNIMIKEDELYFIDYQGGRKGALQYDIASILFDAKADLPQEVRGMLYGHYKSALGNYVKFNEAEFDKYFSPHVLIRILQAMGAYGFRGIFERKTHFLQSIPYALNNLAWLLNNAELSLDIPHLYAVIERIVESDKLKSLYIESKDADKLKVTVSSFSYREGIPVDNSGNGGGYVFDCRFLHNPGRYKEYRDLTGKDKAVVEFMEKGNEAEKFISNVFDMVSTSIDKYLERDFKNLSVNFGCTGGQHRSVYCTEKLAEKLRENDRVEVIVKHTVLENLDPEKS